MLVSANTPFRQRRPHLVVFAALLALSKMGPVRPFSTPPNNVRTTPGFSFGIIADVQWADIDDGSNYAKTTKRCYRGALTTLGNAVDWWLDLPQPPAFVAQLGDLIDGLNNAEQLDQSTEALDAALAHLERLPCPSANLVGNHELYNFDRRAMTALAASEGPQSRWLRHGDQEYYTFSPGDGWRTIVLDAYQISLVGHELDDPRRLEAVEIITRENPNVGSDGKSGDWFTGMEDAGYRRRFVPYNGGFGQEQLEWFREQLVSANEEGERVLVLSHIILHPEACGGGTMAFDYEEALEIMSSKDAGGCVAAVLCGHDHNGNYHCDEGGVHHCTFVSPLNKGDEGSAFGLMNVSPGGLEIRAPIMNDFFPDVEGRPCSIVIDGDDVSGPCESITLPLRDVSSRLHAEDVAVEEVEERILTKQEVAAA